MNLNHITTFYLLQPFNKRCRVLLAIFCLFWTVGYAHNRLPEDELRTLNEAIRNSTAHHAAKTRYIDSLVNLSQTATDNQSLFWHYMTIGDAYRTFIADSAMQYYRRAEQIADANGNKILKHDAEIAMVAGMSIAGFYNEASRYLDSLKIANLSPPQRLNMWKSARQLYSSLISYVGNQSPLYQKYHKEYLAIDDSLLQRLPHSSVDYKFIFAERLVGTTQNDKAKTILLELLSSNPISANIYGKVAYQLAMAYRHINDDKMYAAYLAKAATSDIIGCVTEGWALPMLADWLYQNGELDRAFVYINYSLGEAMAGNARSRSAVISSMIPAIDEAYRKNLTETHNRLIIYLCLAIFLIIITTGLTVILFRQFRKAHKVQTKLAELTRVQEVYLANFVGLCSNYSTRLQSWQKMIIRKIASGQTDDLLKTIKAEKFADENDEFHTSMDQALLELYPNFVEEINTLLRPEEQIHLSKTGAMTPELRIYALIRLGVNESTRIATILQYSTNTIYTYRNKMRNKAIDRENFEQQVRQIGYEA